MPHDDDDFLDALAGREPGDAATPGAREGRELRETLRRTSAALDAAAPSRDRTREATLIARAQREGLIGVTSANRFGRRAVSTAVWGLAATVCLAIGVALFMQPATTPTVERGADGIVMLRSTNPAALQREILADLRAAGVAATGYERLGRYGIDADLPLPIADGVRVILQRHGIEAPSDGTLRVEIAAP